MKKTATLLIAILTSLIVFAQAPACSPAAAIDNCPANNPATITTFNNPTFFSGIPLTTGAQYKYSNIATIMGPPSRPLDAIVSIDAIVNATLTGAINPTIDDDMAADRDGNNVARLFAPRIRPDQNLTCTDRRGYVQFTITFYPHFTGNKLPAPIAVTGLNFVQYDMDGLQIGNNPVTTRNGWFREISYLKKVSNAVPFYTAYSSTELSAGATVADAGGDWLFTYGSTSERAGLSRCAETAEAANYNTAQSSITFRMGYDYHAPNPCINNGLNDKPTRDYGAKFGCYNLPNGAPLPVSINNFSTSYNNGIATINWSSYQEYNISDYVIERSLDGFSFAEVGSVVSRNELTIQQYRFTDNVISLNAPYIFYRIRIMDKEGGRRISNIINLRISGMKKNELLVLPNPSRGNAQLRIKTDKAGTGNILIMDAAGKIVSTQQSQLITGNNTIAINNLSQLSAGYYTVKLIVNEQTYSSKLMIWK